MDNRISLTLKGLALLFRQYTMQNGRLILLSFAGSTSALFVLFYSIHRLTDFNAWTYKTYMSVFMPVFIISAILYTGSSFPGLRSSQKAVRYLSLPVSSTEKFLFELITRIVAFVILMPSLFWITFYLQGQLVALINPDFTFRTFSFLEGFKAPTQRQNILIISFVASQGLLCLTVPFFGATVFRKHPIIKTCACAFGLLFVFLALFNGIVNIIVKQYMFEFTCLIILFNLLLVGLSFYNLKHKQL